MPYIPVRGAGHGSGTITIMADRPDNIRGGRETSASGTGAERYCLQDGGAGDGSRRAGRVVRGHVARVTDTSPRPRHDRPAAGAAGGAGRCGCPTLALNRGVSS